ncbi:Succinate dehydrogenase cytochrome b556 subunit [invertebrate metagenome]|uniref:Succinate dehydrogenase cytochrome b556 subunit n=1 Tax=invertebrate metagenome TaxID=1711999 RepID=A0A2H9TBM4_9ZZZZ
MKRKRPVDLSLTAIKLPVNALVSIAHRLSGVVLFVGVGYLLYLLELSLQSQASFLLISEKLHSPVSHFIVWFLGSALIYHFIAGIKHLMMDMSIGENKKSGMIASWIALGLSAVLIVSLGGWLW